MLVLPHYGDPETAGAGVAMWIFPKQGDPEKARVMKPLLILSPLLGDPREGAFQMSFVAH